MCFRSVPEIQNCEQCEPQLRLSPKRIAGPGAEMWKSRNSCCNQESSLAVATMDRYPVFRKSKSSSKVQKPVIDNSKLGQVTQLALEFSHNRLFTIIIIFIKTIIENQIVYLKNMFGILIQIFRGPISVRKLKKFVFEDYCISLLSM